MLRLSGLPVWGRPLPWGLGVAPNKCLFLREKCLEWVYCDLKL